MASERRPSIGSAHSVTSSASVGSSRRQPPQLAPIPTSTPLTEGTSIPVPSPPLPPVPPPKERLALPMTPQRKPVLRQKSPLSTEAFSSPASSMPGAFPSTPDGQFHAEAYLESSPGTPDSRTSKRTSSFRSFLSFKALRRSYSNTSPDTPGSRPITPGAESSVSSTQPSLGKKMSGSFWKRKSSFGSSSLAGSGEDEDTSLHTMGSPGLNGRTESIMEEDEGRPAIPVPGTEMPTISKRKSGTFWKRRSSLALASALDVDKAGWGKNGENMNGSGHGEVPMTKVEAGSPPPLPTKSTTPPPQLPDFVGGGGSLGGEDLFKDIH